MLLSKVNLLDLNLTMHNEIELFTRFPETKIYFKDNINNILWEQWKKWNECTDKEKEEANLRELFSNEIILDIEDKSLLNSAKNVLFSEDINYEIWDSGSRGFHVHMFFNDLKDKDETYKKMIRRKFIIKYEADLAKASEHTLIARPNKLHFKTLKQKTLIEEINTKPENHIPAYMNTLVLDELSSKSKQKHYSQDTDFKDYFEKDELFNFLNERTEVIPLGTERNNILLKNISIAAAKSGKTEQEFEVIFKPVMERIMPDIPWSQIIASSSWYKKALAGSLVEYNKYEINNWGETHFNKIFYKIDSIPIDIRKQLTKENIDLIDKLLHINKIELLFNLENYLNEIKTIINPDVQEFLIGIIASNIYQKKSDLKNRMTKQIKKESINIFTLKDKIREPVKWYIEKFLPENTGLLIGAKPGKKKSLLTLAACLSLKMNAKYLNEFNVFKPETKILYYDLENGEEIVKERFDYLIKDIQERSMTKPDDNFHLLYTFDKHNLTKEFEMASKFDIIVLDSYRRVLKGEENNSEVTDNFFNDFFKPLRDLRKTIVIIHHFKKGRLEDYEDTDALMDIFRGSSDVSAQFELIYGLLSNNERSSVDGKMEISDLFIKCVKNRRGLPIKNFTVEVTKNDNQEKTLFKFMGNKKFLSPADIKKNLIVSLIEEKKEIHRDDLRKLLKDDNIPERTFDRYIQELIENGSIKKNRQGVYSVHEILETDDDQDILNM